jgi:cell division septum initiation protein DivIVA
VGPAFPLVIRGYERRAVDDYVEALSARIAELEALQSPSVAVKQAVERAADDTASVLNTAHETADGIVTRARQEADRTLTQARAQAERMVADAEARLREIALETDALWQERARLVADAQAVSTQLAELADAAAVRFDDRAPEYDQPTVAFDPLADDADD